MTKFKEVDKVVKFLGNLDPINIPIAFVCGRGMFDLFGGKWLEPSRGVVIYLFHESEVPGDDPFFDVVCSVHKSDRISVEILPENFSFEERVAEIARSLQLAPNVRHE